MATSIATRIGNLQFNEMACRAQIFRHNPPVSSIASRKFLQKGLSWSCGVSKFMRWFQQQTNYSRCSITEKNSRPIKTEVLKCGTVAVITKAEPHESNTNYAQGGDSAVLCPLDSVESHMRDTIVAGAYLHDEETVRVVCTEGPDRIRELIAMGASFDHGEDGNLHLARESGHSHRTIVHAADMTVREIERTLVDAVLNDPNIFVFEHHFAIDLLTSQVPNSHNACGARIDYT